MNIEFYVHIPKDENMVSAAKIFGPKTLLITKIDGKCCLN